MPTKNDLKFEISNLDCRQASFKFINKELRQVRELIERQLKISRDSDVKKLVSSLGVCRGKMIRPALVLLSGASCGAITDRHIHIAAIIEMLHNATLLHDDVIDEGRIRRGGPTINRLFGNEPAVLLGDLLLSRLFKLCAQFEPKIIDFLASTTACICNGELRQTAHKNDYSLSESEYLNIITDKSAALFSDCCFLGALFAQAGKKEKKALSDFGLNFGIAFQLADDLIDITGNETKSGKTLGSDAGKNKPTLVLIHLLRMLNKREKNRLIGQLNKNKIDSKTLRKMVESKGSAQYVRSRVKQFTEKAIFQVRAIKDSTAKKALIDMADSIRRLVS